MKKWLDPPFFYNKKKGSRSSLPNFIHQHQDCNYRVQILLHMVMDGY
jgi:hypothetical protein